MSASAYSSTVIQPDPSNAQKVARSRELGAIANPVPGLFGEASRPSPDIHNTSELLKACANWLRRYVVLSDDQCAVLATWVCHTWAIDAAEFTPYLHITAPEKGCGKTRLLEALRPIVCRPWFTGRVTAAVLVRKIDNERPTLLLDESDGAFGGASDYSEALRGILNSGFEKGGCTSLCVGKGADLTYKDFSCFGAKAIAGIGKIPDTVANRSITISMQKKKAGESVTRFRSRELNEEASQLVPSLEAWAAHAMPTLQSARPYLPPALGERQQDICEPLLAIAELAEGEWPSKLANSLLAIFGSSTSEDDSIGVRLLRSIRTIFSERSGKDADRIASSAIASLLCDMEGEPWADWSDGKGMDANRLAKALRRYYVRPKTIRVEGGTTLKGYTREDFSDLWTRYCPDIHAAGVTAVTERVNIDDPSISPDVTLPNVTPASVYANPHKQRVVTGVTAVTASQTTRTQEQLFEGSI